MQSNLTRPSVVGLATVFEWVAAPRRTRGGGDRRHSPGSNAREAHPIYFHHVLKGLDNGAGCTPSTRTTSSAKFADAWLASAAGTDAAAANAMGRDHRGRALQRGAHRTLSQGFEQYKAHVDPYTLEYAEFGHRRARRGDLGSGPRLRQRRRPRFSGRARHHRTPQRRRQREVAVQPRPAHRPSAAGVRASCRFGARTMCRAAAMQARPTSCRASKTSSTRAPGEVRDRVRQGAQPEQWQAPHLMLEAMEHGEIVVAAYCIGENPADSEASPGTAAPCSKGSTSCRPGHLHDRHRRARRRRPPVVGRLGRCDGTVTSSERRVARAGRHPARRVPPRSRDHRRSRQAHGRDSWGDPTPQELWDEFVRSRRSTQA